MMILPLLALLGLGGLLLGSPSRSSSSPRPKAKTPKPPLMDEQQRIVREMEEIAQGKRAELSDPGEVPALASDATPLMPIDAKPPLMDEQQRIVREVAEIAQGKREELSPSPASADDEQALAEAAARAAAAQEGGAAAPKAAKPAKGKVAKPGARAPASPAPARPVNLALAKSTAPAMAAHLKQKKMNYDRKALTLWQSRAGVPADGIYGRGSAAALKYFTPAAPPALFAQGTSSYTPPRA